MHEITPFLVQRQRRGSDDVLRVDLQRSRIATLTGTLRVMQVMQVMPKMGKIEIEHL